MYFAGAAVIIVLLIVFLMGTPIPVQKPRVPSVSTSSAQTVLGQTTKTAGCTVSNGLPDGACTPGGISPAVTQDNIHSTICVSGYSTSVRPPESVTNKIKKERLVAYGDTDSMSDYELDHLISLELGGCPDCVSNLWPEPYANPLGAHEKDKVENYLHKEVCDGTITLHDAQEEIATDWESVYNQLPKN
jgi:hypothetical protein